MEGHSGSGGSDVVLSSDGQFALSGSWDGELRLWDLSTGLTTRRFVGHAKDVISVAFSVDNRQIVSASRDNTIKLWNTLGECKYTIGGDMGGGEGHTGWVSCVRFSPNIQQPTIVSGSWDKTVKVWNLTNCKLRSTLAGHGGYVNAVAVSPDGSLCASGGKDGVTLLWDLSEGKRLYQLEAGSIIHALCFSPNRYWLCAATEESVKIWDLESKHVVQDLKPEVQVSKNQMLYCTSLSWSADGSTLYTGYTDGTIRVFKIQAGFAGLFTTHATSPSSTKSAAAWPGLACHDQVHVQRSRSRRSISFSRQVEADAALPFLVRASTTPVHLIPQSAAMSSSPSSLYKQLGLGAAGSPVNASHLLMLVLGAGFLAFTVFVVHPNDFRLQSFFSGACPGSPPHDVLSPVNATPKATTPAKHADATTPVKAHPGVRVLIGIQTMPGKYERRHLLRTVYALQLQEHPALAGAVDVRFVFCNVTSAMPCDRENFYPFPPFMSGMGYALSWDLVRWVARSEVSRRDRVGPEDMWTGRWLNVAGKAKNRYDGAPRMYNYLGSSPANCFRRGFRPDTIAVHMLKDAGRWVETLAYFNATAALPPSALYHLP
uniref:Uncharacterized protein n=1 Tax=Aegilops tauschii TaxID=37682 RepID=N1QTR7_AEGTA